MNWAQTFIALIREYIENQRKIMSAITDLRDALVDVEAKQDEVIARLKAQGGLSEEDQVALAQAVATVNAMAVKLAAA